MRNLINLITATRGKPILILRLIDTIALKVGLPSHHIPKIKVSEKVSIRPFRIQVDSVLSDFEEHIADRFIAHNYCILSDRWRCFNNIDSGNSVIDWQKDYKSGFIFNIKEYSSDCLKNIPTGTDIKIPWELARMQYLLLIARTCATGKISPKKACAEVEEIITDFISNNPVGYGVNWACAMDVAIRAVNILVVYDVLFHYKEFRNDFTISLAHSMLEHGAYIFRNLEKNFTADKSGNHYLSDLCGLIVIACHLNNVTSKGWLSFAAEELFEEIEKQLFDDGGNYEFSTAYHRLDAELIAVSVAFLVAAGFTIPERISSKIHSALEFMRAILYSDGEIVQIGDNDSGHLIRLSYKGTMCDETPQIDELQGIAAVNLLNALFETRGNSAEHLFIRSLMKDTVLKWTEIPKKVQPTFDVGGFVNKKETVIKIDGKEGRKLKLFPDFGLAVFEKQKFKAFFRLPTDIKRGKPLHIHSDFLHFEYELNGQKKYRDRGSYTYTGDIEKRNLFRSADFHNVPLYETEQNEYSGVWNVNHKVSGSWYCDNNYGITARIKLADIIHQRRICLEYDRLLITDESNQPFSEGYCQGNIFSSGYGIMTVLNDYSLEEKNAND